MLGTHDNWEKLVTATLRKEQLWQLCHASSPSISSVASSDLSTPDSPDLPLHCLANTSEAAADDEIYVNNKLLDAKELGILKDCLIPPTNLRPNSYYWYEKRAGFWGKIGHKPSQIISANLDIGGRLDRCASNGNTLVYINGREITKVELGLLKFANVQCYPNANIWMYEDGSYLVHGLVCQRSNIWGKVGMRLLCFLLSLSFPSTSLDDSGVTGNIVDIKKLVLIGRSGSGKSTIFKQAKFLYTNVPFMKDELNNIKMLIRSNIYGYIRILLEVQQNFEDEHLDELTMYQFSDEQQLAGYYTAPEDGKHMFSICPRLKAFSIWLLNILKLGTLDLSSTYLIQHYAPLVEELWRDSAIQRALERAIESRMLPSVASYFLTRAVDIFKPTYTPSRMDILYAEDPTSYTYTSYLNFSFSGPHDDVDGSVNQQALFPRYQLIKSPSFGFEDNIEKLEMFEDAGMVIFCVPLSDYDQFVANEEGYINMMMLDRKLFENVVTCPTFDHPSVLLLLTKYDSFEEKIKQSPLNQCDFLANFNPIENRAGEEVDDLAEIAFHYISVQFKRLYAAATGRKLYVSKVNGLDEESVNGVMKFAREMLKWEEEIKSSHYVDQQSRRKFLLCV